MKYNKISNRIVILLIKMKMKKLKFKNKATNKKIMDYMKQTKKIKKKKIEKKN